ncbi:MAG TPA: proline iminopeptidase-family hydrolase [Thermomicrobiales bacterium]|nr:proline iminopeptidase-family hydrolase [Thermomicrobiales bacterium]
MTLDANRSSEGFVAAPGGRVWYESAGDGPVALLLLHGGPGAPSDYLTPLMALADDGYRVVRYDQLGSRRSDKPDDASLWQAPRFVAEVESVRRALGLGRMHLLGQSWGAFLALEYALHHGDALRSLTLASGAASTAECLAGMRRWREALPEAMQAALARCEAAEDYAHSDYQAAMDELYQRHLCRIWPFPDVMAESMANMATPVYTTMWGPAEFTCTGNLLSWDRSHRLGEISVPTLITVGRYDEVDPACAATLHRGIRGSRLEVFEESSHSAHLEEPERYLTVLRDFLAGVDAAEDQRWVG